MQRDSFGMANYNWIIEIEEKMITEKINFTNKQKLGFGGVFYDNSTYIGIS